MNSKLRLEFFSIIVTELSMKFSERRQNVSIFLVWHQISVLICQWVVTEICHNINLVSIYIFPPSFSGGLPPPFSHWNMVVECHRWLTPSFGDSQPLSRQRTLVAISHKNLLQKPYGDKLTPFWHRCKLIFKPLSRKFRWRRPFCHRKYPLCHWKRSFCHQCR